MNITTQMDAVYLYGHTGKIAKRVNDITDYYHTDHLGSTRLVTSENGTITEEIIYEPFGEQINASQEKYTYNGKEVNGNNIVVGYFVDFLRYLEEKIRKEVELTEKEAA